MKRLSRVYLYIILIIMLVAVSLFGGCYNRTVFYYGDGNTPNTTPQAEVKELSESLSQLSGASVKVNTVENAGSVKSITEVTSMVANSVVELNVTAQGSAASGSGILFATSDTKYYILTNHHVIEGATTVKCVLTDGTEKTATVVASDADSDIGVVTIGKTGVDGEKYKSVVIPSDDYKIRVGDTAIAIGNPLGTLGGTVTAGIVSALDRQVSVEGVTMTLLQTDASINQGNSGGGLFDAYGQLIGVVNAKMMASGIEGLGFAIPVKTAVSVASDLITKGYVSGRPMIGVNLLELNSSDKRVNFLLELSEDDYDEWNGYLRSTGNALGLYVYKVTNEASGLKVGDYIVSADGTQVATRNEFGTILAGHKVGDNMTIVVKRGGKNVTVVVKLIEKTAS